MRKVISIILIFSMLVMVGGASFGTPQEVKNGNIEKFKNYEVRYTNGIRLITKTNSNTIQKGLDFTASIKIKNKKINGKILVQDGERFILKGELNEEKLKYEGKVLNKKEIIFEAFTLDDGALLINIINNYDTPETYLLNGKKAKKISRNNMRLYSYYNDIESGSVDGIHYKLQGPNDPTGDPLWSLSFKTDVEDAWSDSGLDGYMRYGAYVQNARFGIKSNDGNSVYNFVKPNSSGDESFDFPVMVYLGSIGWQLISVPVATSSTSISGMGDPHNYVDFNWSNFSGYLHEYTESYDENEKGFGVKIEQHREGSGPWLNSAYITMNYKLIAKKSEYTSTVYAYPEYQVDESLLTWTVE